MMRCVSATCMQAKKNLKQFELARKANQPGDFFEGAVMDYNIGIFGNYPRHTYVVALRAVLVSS